MSTRTRAKRLEVDSMGEVYVPGHALYGASTQRAVDNFPVSDYRLPKEFITCLALVKLCAAEENSENGGLSKAKARAIAKACREVISGKWDDQFVVDVFQTGSGTSTNLNMNEVLARRARLILRRDPDDRDYIHPNDHINLFQSSNDVIPTALNLSALILIGDSLLPALYSLSDSFTAKADEFSRVVKNGRTHHQDATPITLGQEFSGYAHQIKEAADAIRVAADRLKGLAIGGTAVGTGVNSPAGFGSAICGRLRKELGFTVEETTNHFRAQATIDDVVLVSGALRLLCVTLMKVLNDLRWMSSGPASGLAEVRIPAVQPGSSIMPGKVNPVILESVYMVCLHVLGADTAIAFAGQSGSFELNTTQPVVAFNLLTSIKLLARSVQNLRAKCVDGIEVNPRGLQGVEYNNALATALSPVIGYDRAAKIAKLVSETGKTVLEVAIEETGMPESVLANLLNPLTMTRAGTNGQSSLPKMQRQRKGKGSTMASKKRQGFRVGDRVEILGFKTAISWGNRKPQRYGFIVSIDGAYIGVRPRWWAEGEIIERYPGEIKLA